MFWKWAVSLLLCLFVKVHVPDYLAFTHHTWSICPLFLCLLLHWPKDACRRAANHFSPVFYWFLRDLRYMFVAFLLPQLIIWWCCISSWVCLCMCALALALLEANLYFIDNILAINLFRLKQPPHVSPSNTMLLPLSLDQFVDVTLRLTY